MSIQTDNFSEPRVTAPTAATPIEEALERALRPKQLDEYIGQEKIRHQLEIFIAAARNRREALDHTLLFGPPGLGKTTLAHIIAKEMGVNLRQTSGPVLERPGDLAAILSNLEPMTCCSSTKYTGCHLWSKKFCTRRWKTTRSTS